MNHFACLIFTLITYNRREFGALSGQQRLCEVMLLMHHKSFSVSRNDKLRVLSDNLRVFVVLAVYLGDGSELTTQEIPKQGFFLFIF